MGLFSKKHTIETFEDILSELIDYDNAGVALLPEEYFTIGYFSLQQKQGIRVPMYWLSKAYNSGHLGAITPMINLLNETNGDKFSEETITLLEEAASQGNRPCMATYGILLLEGNIIEKDEQRGLEIIRLAADMGDLTAAAILGEEYFRGGLVDKNDDLAKYWLIKAAVYGLQNDGVDQYLSSLLSEEELDKISNDNYFEFYQKAAANGCADALYYMYLNLIQGFHIQKDEAKAMDCLRKAAGLGHLEAKATLAVQEEERLKSENGRVDAGEAHRILSSLEGGLETGEALSFIVAGDLYYTGSLGENEYEKAYEYYHQATSRLNLAPCASVAQMIAYEKYLPSEDLIIKGRQDINTLHALFFKHVKDAFDGVDLSKIC